MSCHIVSFAMSEMSSSLPSRHNIRQNKLLISEINRSVTAQQIFVTCSHYRTSASNPSPDSHKCSKCPTTLHHRFTNCVHKLASPQTISRHNTWRKQVNGDNTPTLLQEFTLVPMSAITTYTVISIKTFCNYTKLALILLVSLSD